MKREKQIIESKDMIKDALLDLLLKKQYYQITISDLAKNAGISRMTIYRHFNDIDAVFYYYFSGILATVKNELSTIKNPTISDLICVRFQVFKRYNLASILKNDTQLISMMKIFAEASRKEFSDLLPSIHDDYLASFVSGGIDSITNKWIEDGMIKTPEEMTKKIMMIVKSII